MLLPARLPAPTAELSFIVRKLSRTQLLSFDTSMQRHTSNSFALIHLQNAFQQPLSFDTSILPPGYPPPPKEPTSHESSRQNPSFHRVSALLLLLPLGATMLSIRETSPLLPVSNTGERTSGRASAGCQIRSQVDPGYTEGIARARRPGSNVLRVAL